MAQQRPLSLTEELERLEQSITLTLQEIDHNFSRAHRIVTSSILPIVEEYANHSKDVWEGSKFWKQFFESSANVSLSGYEEQPSIQEAIEETVTENSNATTHTTLETSESYETPSARSMSAESMQDIDFSNLTISPSHSTPRPIKAGKDKYLDYPSPYEALRQEVNTTTNLDATAISHSNDEPQTPGRQTTITDDMAMTPDSSPLLPERPSSIPRPTSGRKKTDPLLHRVLDRSYRIQATPLTANRFTSRIGATPASTTRSSKAYASNSLSSSPEIAPPQLHAEIFSSPVRKQQTVNQQRTPGISVLTPARNRNAGDNLISKAPARTPGIWDSDEDDDFDEATGMPYGVSPPKTMQFHIPQSRLLQTPAREASQRIVNDILETAGVGRSGHDDGNLSDDFEIDVDAYETEPEQASPSVVRKVVGIEDETF